MAVGTVFLSFMLIILSIVRRDFFLILPTLLIISILALNYKDEISVDYKVHLNFVFHSKF